LAKKEEEDGGETAFDTCTYTRSEVQRLAKKRFELAMTRTKTMLC
jgi:3-isopropylmalate dehydrogenase